jgi:short-subunit dehydrogenase
LEELAAECESNGTIAVPVEIDVSNQADVERLAQTAINSFGLIDVWINNAGVAAIGRFEDSPLEDHVQVVSTDLLGTIFGSFFALQQFRKQSYGTLINVASIVGKVPVPYYASYTAANFGVVELSCALRQELRQNKDTITGGQ